MSTSQRVSERKFNHNGFWGSVKDIQRAAEEYAKNPVEESAVPDVLKENIVLAQTALVLFDKKNEERAKKILRRHLRECFSFLRSPMSDHMVRFIREEHNRDTLVEPYAGFYTAYTSVNGKDDVVIWSDIFKRLDDDTYYARCGVAWAPLMEARKLSAEGVLAEEVEEKES